MTVNNISECLQTINDANSTMTTSATGQSSIAPTNPTISSGVIPENFTVLSNNVEPSLKSNTSTESISNPSTVINSSTNNSNISTNTHSLAALRKARPKSGRNHAGAKHLASMYTQG